MKTVIYFKASERTADSTKLSGVRDVARQEGWNLQVVMPASRAETVHEILDLWHPDGCLLSCGSGQNDLPSRFFGRIPIVYLDRPRSQLVAGDSVVSHDATAAARLAVREMIGLGLAHFAYVPWDADLLWDRERQTAFSSALALHGHSSVSFATTVPPDRPQLLIPELLRWIKRLPRPIGIFAAADPVAAQVLEACRLAGRSVPEEIVVISVNNECEICENTKPSLSSIDLGFAEAGRQAATLLKRLMSRRSAKPLHATYHPVGLVRRKSTLHLVTRDHAVADALELIRRESCNGLTAREVLKLFPCSRRMAELRFRTLTGESILEAIRGIRLARAKELLARQTHSLGAIANFCGYSHPSAFTMFFKSATGIPPSLWRGDGSR